MLYPIAIETGDSKHAYGVVFPDIPNCFSAGDTLEEALSNAKEAVEMYLEELAERAPGNSVEVRVPFDDIGVVEAGGFDGVTAALRVNASVHAPLLCVAQVFKVASGNLSLPGQVDH